MATRIHIDEKTYNEIADFILEGGNGWFDSETISVLIDATSHYETSYTGVEYNGYKETSKDLVLDGVRIIEFSGWDAEGDAVPCDFDVKKVYDILNI